MAKSDNNLPANTDSNSQDSNNSSLTEKNTPAFDINLLVKKTHKPLATRLKRYLTHATPRVRARTAHFLWLTAQGMTFKKAAAEAEIGWAQLQSLKAHNPGFWEIYEVSRECMRAVQLHEMEDALHERGTVGWEEKIYRNGVFAGVIRRYSDKCLELSLKANDPKYKDKADIKINVGAKISFTSIGVDHSAQQTINVEAEETGSNTGQDDEEE